MAQWTKEVREQKIQYAKQLYCKGFNTATIADIMGDVSPRTIDTWAKTYKFEGSKRSQIIALSEIRNSILESYAALLDGEKPKIKPDEAVKYAAAFEKFSSKKQVLTYMYEAFEMLSEEYMKSIQSAKTLKEKEKSLADYKQMRNLSSAVISRLTQEVIEDD